MLCLEFHCAVTAVTRLNPQSGDVRAERPCEARCGPVCAFNPGGGNAAPGARNRRLSPPRSGCFSDRAFCRIPGLSAPGRWVDSQAGESAGVVTPRAVHTDRQSRPEKARKIGAFPTCLWDLHRQDLGVANPDYSANRGHNGEKVRVSAKFSGVAGDLLFKHEHDFKNYHERGKNDVLVYQTETETE